MVCGGGQEQGVEESAKLVDGQRDQPGRGGCGVAFDGGGHGQEGVGEHGQGGPAVPGAPAPDLVLIESGQAFGGLEGFLDAPALTGHGAPGCAAAPGAGCSSAGRPARRWCRCGGSANDADRPRRVGVVFGVAENAHEYRRGPLRPAPAEWRCQARVGIRAAAHRRGSGRCGGDAAVGRRPTRCRGGRDGFTHQDLRFDGALASSVGAPGQPGNRRWRRNRSAIA